MNDDQNNTPNEHQKIPSSVNRPHLDTAWSPVADAMRHDIEITTTKQGNPIDPADAGSSASRLFALLITILMVGSVIVWQNTSEDFKHTLFYNSPAPVIEIQPDQLAPGSYGQIDLAGRFLLRSFDMLGSQIPMSQIDNGQVLYSDEDSVRLIMLAGELEGTQAALDRIAQLKQDLSTPLPNQEESQPDSTNNDLILAELNTLDILYTLGPDLLPENRRDHLVARYGLIAKVALTHGLDNTDPLREPLINNGLMITLFALFFILVIVVVPLAGLVLLILGIIKLASGNMPFHNHVPAKGGSIFLETYALFVGGFLVMSVATFFVSYSSMPELASFSLLAQWLLLLTVLWGLVRGMRLKPWRKAIGWHTGKGIFKEIGIGIIAYMASIPIYILGVVITIIVLFASEAIKISQNNGIPAKPEPLTNPIFEIVASGDWKVVLLLFILATTWAPIVEEAIFRGALYRHLRGSMHWVLAALASAILFAYMHDYGPLMVAPLIALGFMFAFMREWRGSLIAPMTAHFLHNFTLMSFMIILVQLIKDPI